jgi:hypothetical protein
LPAPKCSVELVVENVGSDWVLDKGLARSRRPPLRVFCERVRKLLMGKELWEHSFWKSAEECEKEGLNFSSFLQKSEKSAWGRDFCLSGGRVVLLDREFNAPTRSG